MCRSNVEFPSPSRRIALSCYLLFVRRFLDCYGFSLSCSDQYILQTTVQPLWFLQEVLFNLNIANCSAYVYIIFTFLGWQIFLRTFIYLLHRNGEQCVSILFTTIINNQFQTECTCKNMLVHAIIEMK